MATDAMMDIDMDIEFEDPEIARMQAAAAQMQAMPDMAVEEQNEMQEVKDVEEGEVASNEPVANKIYIQGDEISSLTSRDLENFAQDNFDDGGAFQRIEWIDDTSAKIVYASANAAADALIAFSASPAENPLEPRRAVALATHPHVELFVRQAVVTDQKQSGAADRSKFYNENPMYRPDRPYQGRGNGGPRRGGPRGPRRGNKYHPTHNGRPGSANGPDFTEILYDDDAESVAARRASQDSFDREQRAARDRFGRRGSQDLFARRGSQDLFAGKYREPRGRAEDLFASKSNGRLARDRSASPLREGDGRYGFSDDVPYRETARYRSPPPPRLRSRDVNSDTRNSMREDLFPNKKAHTALTNGNDANPTELFPSRASKGHRPVQNGHTNDAAGKPDLISRFTGGPGMVLKSERGRLNASTSPFGGDDGGFSFKGRGKNSGDDGEYSIRGASKEQDLFPGRGRGGRGGDGSGAKGADLFAGKTKAKDRAF